MMQGIQLGTGLTMAGIKEGKAGRIRRMAKKIHPIEAFYTEDPNVAGLYSEGKNLYQGRMVGATQAEQGISTDEANATAFGERNATDSSQLLSFGAGVYGQGAQARQQLAVREAEDKQQRFGIYSQVTQLMNQEREKVFMDKLRKYYDDLNYKRALEAAASMRSDEASNLTGQSIMDAAGGSTSINGQDGGGNSGGGGMGGGMGSMMGMFGSMTGGGGAGGAASAGSAVGAAGAAYSDIQLKENYHIVGKSPSGINIYEFSYIGNQKRFRGVMAGDVPQASILMKNGFYAVDYSKIDVAFEEVH